MLKTRLKNNIPTYLGTTVKSKSAVISKNVGGGTPMIIFSKILFALLFTANFRVTVKVSPLWFLLRVSLTYMQKLMSKQDLSFPIILSTMLKLSKDVNSGQVNSVMILENMLECRNNAAIKSKFCNFNYSTPWEQSNHDITGVNTKHERTACILQIEMFFLHDIV